MRLREQLFRKEQQRKKRAEAAAAERERKVHGFLGQNSVTGQDCDDKDRNRYPGNTEVCDSRGHDEDCDPRTVGSKDLDKDGYVSSECR